MAIRIPVDIAAEFRGLAVAGQFRSKETGELVDIPPKYKFEVELGGGDDVEMLVLSQSALEKARADFPLGSLRRGDRIRVVGAVVLQDRGSDRDSYLSVLQIDRVSDAAAKPVAVKSSSAS
ncbi:MAG TPA: hypothetical protein VGP17_10800 [Solirubrobacteraceae bacterium]|nr:hypothetical protein [Solirubrobacteraceae bacterium]